MAWTLYEMLPSALDPASEEASTLLYIHRALERLAHAGIRVEGYEFMSEPAVFLAEPTVAQALEDGGDAAFPLLMIDGVCRKQGAYPTSEEWAAWSGLSPEDFPTVFPEIELEMWRYFLEMTQGGGGCSSCQGGCGGCGGGCGGHDDLVDFEGEAD